MMRLVSNFRDYYDHAFGKTEDAFVRMNDATGPSKRDQFALLTKAGFFTPPHGLVEDVLGSWWEEEKSWIRNVVSYENEYSHNGKDKIRLRHHDFQLLGSRMDGGPEAHRLRNLYCSAWVGSECPKPSVSWRRLQVGPHVFWIEYRSTDSWMSNVGEGDCELLSTELDYGFVDEINYPLFAVDFVIGKELYAIDLNIAPGFDKTGVEDVLPPTKVVSAIEAWHANKSPSRP